MTQDNIPEYQQVADAISLCGSELNPSEWQGLILGSICFHLKTGTEPKLRELMFGARNNSEEIQPLMELTYSAYRAIMEELLSAEDILELMVPDDEESIEYRTESVAAWCQGYTLGLLQKEKFSIDQLPPDAAEFTRDVMDISQASLGEDGQENERALMEVVEFLRVGAQLSFELIYAEQAHPAPPSVQ
ncbi:MAG TPA: hypothetical protein DCY55_05520 [Gammaproteobacteria bacterium]|jgi:uncharacterized protein|nr:hypothetical protein [Gammaproteobacteria bacterium]